MPMRNFSLVIGIVLLAMGVLSFIPVFTTAPYLGDPALAADGAHVRFLGIFPANWLLDLARIGLGIWGIVASRTYLDARVFSRTLCVLYAVLAVMGLFPVLNTFFGMAPLYGHNIWLHAVVASIAGYFGYVRHDVPGTHGLQRPVTG